MDDATRVLVRLSAALSREDREALLDAMDDAALHAAPEQVEEALLQSHLFLGYPAALNSLGLWRKRTERPPRVQQGEGAADWRRRGEAVCRRVYDDHYEALREAMRQIHPELDDWAVTDGYGKVLGRPGLDLRRRELCITAMLSGIDAPRQLFAHLRGALNVGAAPADVEAMFDAVSGVLPAARVANARRVWDKVRERHPALDSRGTAD